MLRPRFFLFGLCICAAFLHFSPAYAQANEDLRPILPTSKTGELPRDIGSVESPELRRSEAPGRDNAVQGQQSGHSVRVGSVLIDASPSVDHAMFDTVIEPFLGRSVTDDELAKLAQQIADVARANGMVLASAYVPAQQIELGIVKIVLRTGTIDEIRIEGSNNRALRQLLEPLTSKTVMKGELERRLTLAGDLPQIVLEQTELLTEGGRQVLLVKVSERKRIRGRLTADNYGSNNIGPFRARLGVDAVALLSDSDFANVTFRANPAEPKELLSASISYGVALNDNGTRTEFAIASSKSQVESSSPSRNRTARSQYASLAINHPLHRSRTSNLWIESQLEYLEIDQDALNIALQSDTVVTVSVALSSSVRVGPGWMRVGTQFRQGLGLFDATRANDPLASRRDADGQFTMARVWASWSGKPVGEMTVRIAVSGQVANQPLLASEELGLGGAFVGRAFEFYERSGDQGVLGLAEVGVEFSRPASWLKRLQPYVFVDGGFVENLRGGFGGGTLISTGAGIRGETGPIGLQLEAAVPVHSTGRNAINSDPKVNFQVGLNF